MHKALAYRAALALTVVNVCLGLAACGSSRASSGSRGTPAATGAFKELSYPTDGFAISAPQTWLPAETLSSPGGVATLTSGQAVISLFRYGRSGGPLSTTPELTSACNALVSAAKAKDRSLTILRSDFTTVSGDGAAILSGTEKIDGQVRRIRSEHVYAAGAEIVLDEYAPPAQFASVDHRVFSPVRKSLVLLGAG